MERELLAVKELLALWAPEELKLKLGEEEALPVADGQAGTLQLQPGFAAQELMLRRTAPPLAPSSPGAPPAVLVTPVTMLP